MMYSTLSGRRNAANQRGRQQPGVVRPAAKEVRRSLMPLSLFESGPATLPASPDFFSMMSEMCGKNTTEDEDVVMAPPHNFPVTSSTRALDPNPNPSPPPSEDAMEPLPPSWASQFTAAVSSVFRNTTPLNTSNTNKPFNPNIPQANLRIHPARYGHSTSQASSQRSPDAHTPVQYGSHGHTATATTAATAHSGSQGLHGAPRQQNCYHWPPLEPDMTNWHRTNNHTATASNELGSGLEWPVPQCHDANSNAAAAAGHAEDKDGLLAPFEFPPEELAFILALNSNDPSLPDLMDTSSSSASSYSVSSNDDFGDSKPAAAVTPSPNKNRRVQYSRQGSLSSMNTQATYTDSVYSMDTEDGNSLSAASVSDIPKSKDAARKVGGVRQKKRPPRKPHPTVKKYVEFNDRDVLCGRGGLTNHHPGNLVYRKRILETQPMYKTLTNNEKTQLSESIVKWVQNDCDGRFLEKDEKGYFVVEDKSARTKVSQALREDHTEKGKAAKKAKQGTGRKKNRSKNKSK
jgi:hypothetical protein